MDIDNLDWDYEDRQLAYEAVFLATRRQFVADDAGQAGV